MSKHAYPKITSRAELQNYFAHHVGTTPLVAAHRLSQRFQLKQILWRHIRYLNQQG